MLFGILIFDPKWGFCMGYNSLCMMADFQNGLISRIFSVFRSGFLHRTTLNDLYNGFWHVFCNVNVWPKWGFCMGYSLCMIADFKNGLISRIFTLFSSAFLHTTTLNCFWSEFWHVFWNFNFSPKWGFFKGFSLCMMTDFQTGLTSRVFSVFGSGFLHRTTLNHLYNKFWQVFWNFNIWPKVLILLGL